MLKLNSVESEHVGMEQRDKQGMCAEAEEGKFVTGQAPETWGPGLIFPALL